MTRCPDVTANPDFCDVCEGWGHRCTAWRRTHPTRIAEVERVYHSGYDPTHFYTSTAAAQAGEYTTAQRRKEQTRKEHDGHVETQTTRR
jgi:hypothetical protein